MKESNILVSNVAYNFLRRKILMHTKEQYIYESNSIADTAIIKQLQRKILMNIKGQYTKESNTLVRNVANSSHRGEI